MIKQIFALLRGIVSDTAQSFTDRQGLTILRQQINDSARTVQAARNTVAVAVAQNEQEKEQYQQILSRIADLEVRTLAALEQDNHDIAQEAAETIAFLETERDNSKAALDQFQSGLETLKSQVRIAEMRLRDLKRGQRMADATDKTQKMRSYGETSTASTLSDAEETLKQLRLRQQEIDYTADAIAQMDQDRSADQIIAKLADAGCGKPLKTTTDDVLQRLKQQKASQPDSQIHS